MLILRSRLGPGALGARALGGAPWALCLVIAAVGFAGVTPLAWVGAGLVAGISLSGSI
ncbi:MAG TPA: hypothetical protein VGJ86_15820 [Acidimicrobiales bacterium]